MKSLLSLKGAGFTCKPRILPDLSTHCSTTVVQFSLFSSFCTAFCLFSAAKRLIGPRCHLHEKTEKACTFSGFYFCCIYSSPVYAVDYYGFNGVCGRFYRLFDELCIVAARARPAPSLLYHNRGAAARRLRSLCAESRLPRILL